MSDITSRKVTRWYYRGKGYASRNAAYRAKAYQLLLDVVLGESGLTTDYNDAGNSMDIALGRSKLRQLTSQTEVDVFMRSAFAEMFPHSDTLDTECVGICQILYTPDGEEFDSYVYASCKRAQKVWINNKASELIAQEGEDHV